MPREVRKRKGPELPEVFQNLTDSRHSNIAIDKSKLTRKQLRQQARKNKKQRKSNRKDDIGEEPPVKRAKNSSKKKKKTKKTHELPFKRPEPQMDPEDKMIEYLSNKLKISDGKLNSGLANEYEKDGFEGDFFSSLDNIIAMGGNIEGDDGIEKDFEEGDFEEIIDIGDDEVMEEVPTDYESDEDDYANDDYMNSGEMIDLDGILGGLTSTEAETIDSQQNNDDLNNWDTDDEEQQDGQEKEAEQGDDEEEEEEEDRAEIESGDEGDKEAKTIHFLPKKNIYGDQSTSVAGQSMINPGKYIPPSMRAKLKAESNPENIDKLLKLKRQLQTHINKIADSNIDPITRSVVDVFSMGAHADVTSTLAEVVCSNAISSNQVLSSLIRSLSCLVVAVHLQIGRNCGAVILEKICSKLEETRKELKNLENQDTLEGQQLTKRGSNLALFLVFFYLFGMIHSDFIVELLKYLIESFNPMDVSLVRLCLSHCGVQLRKDDPMAVRDLVLLIQKQAKSHGIEAEKSLSSEDVDDNVLGAFKSRVQFMLLAIYDVKNNKKTKMQDLELERSVRLRKWLRSLANRVDKEISTERFKMGWKELINAESGGRWWVTGAPWAQTKNNLPRSKMGGGNSNGGDGDGTNPDDEETNAEVLKLNELARKQRMNSETHRNVFKALMTADDYEDAFEKLMTLGLKGKQERIIMLVIVNCCGNEKTYNPFYSLVAHKLCTVLKSASYTFQLLLWDVFKTFNSISAREAYNLAKFMAFLVSKFTLSLAMLKTVDFTDLLPRGTLFFKTMFADILKDENESNLVFVFDKLTQGKHQNLARDGVALFLHTYVKKFLIKTKLLKPEEKKIARKNLKLALQSVERRINDDDDEEFL
eukprot:TRINITY_DN681_c0_g1_i1.p1 TRINITY_DN681_c0_g1~~TRINITY_DN681_c0_g1_i1.p1  ORF type:complete len:871 (+),score=303.77 TRINITY_DN681_c0_g1_i1:50-2662(+)